MTDTPSAFVDTDSVPAISSVVTSAESSHPSDVSVNASPIWSCRSVRQLLFRIWKRPEIISRRMNAVRDLTLSSPELDQVAGLTFESGNPKSVESSMMEPAHSVRWRLLYKVLGFFACSCCFFLFGIFTGCLVSKGREDTSVFLHAISMYGGRHLRLLDANPSKSMHIGEKELKLQGMTRLEIPFYVSGWISSHLTAIFKISLIHPFSGRSGSCGRSTTDSKLAGGNDTISVDHEYVMGEGFTDVKPFGPSFYYVGGGPAALLAPVQTVAEQDNTLKRRSKTTMWLSGVRELPEYEPPSGDAITLADNSPKLDVFVLSDGSLGQSLAEAKLTVSPLAQFPAGTIFNLLPGGVNAVQLDIDINESFDSTSELAAAAIESCRDGRLWIWLQGAFTFFKLFAVRPAFQIDFAPFFLPCSIQT
eukprot:GHVT01082798.1.p1 GENE.GHVT01082798.1~~GHVT01082798.1.p1  ORF type:complete len:419 (+),score=32.22 GHVT01082798.1:492-1748(+)